MFADLEANKKNRMLAEICKQSAEQQLAFYTQVQRDKRFKAADLAVLLASLSPEVRSRLRQPAINEEDAVKRHQAYLAITEQRMGFGQRLSHLNKYPTPKKNFNERIVFRLLAQDEAVKNQETESNPASLLNSQAESQGSQTAPSLAQNDPHVELPKVAAHISMTKEQKNALKLGSIGLGITAVALLGISALSNPSSVRATETETKIPYTSTAIPPLVVPASSPTIHFTETKVTVTVPPTATLVPTETGTPTPTPTATRDLEATIEALNKLLAEAQATKPPTVIPTATLIPATPTAVPVPIQMTEAPATFTPTPTATLNATEARNQEVEEILKALGVTKERDESFTLNSSAFELTDESTFLDNLTKLGEIKEKYPELFAKYVPLYDILMSPYSESGDTVLLGLNNSKVNRMDFKTLVLNFSANDRETLVQHSKKFNELVKLDNGKVDFASRPLDTDFEKLLEEGGDGLHRSMIFLSDIQKVQPAYFSLYAQAARAILEDKDLTSREIENLSYAAALRLAKTTTLREFKSRTSGTIKAQYAVKNDERLKDGVRIPLTADGKTVAFDGNPWDTCRIQEAPDNKGKDLGDRVDQKPQAIVVTIRQSDLVPYSEIDANGRVQVNFVIDLEKAKANLGKKKVTVDTVVNALAGQTAALTVFGDVDGYEKIPTVFELSPIRQRTDAEEVEVITKFCGIGRRGEAQTPVPKKPEDKVTPPPKETPGTPMKTVTPPPEETPKTPEHPTVTPAATNKPETAPTIVNTPESNSPEQPTVIPTPGPSQPDEPAATPVIIPTSEFKN